MSMRIASVLVELQNLMVAQIRRFRDLLEWGREVPIESSEPRAGTAHVHVYFPFPAPGHFNKVAKGTTAAEALRKVCVN